MNFSSFFVDFQSNELFFFNGIWTCVDGHSVCRYNIFVFLNWCEQVPVDASTSTDFFFSPPWGSIHDQQNVFDLN